LYQLQGEGCSMCLSRPPTKAVSFNFDNRIHTTNWSRQDRTTAEIIDVVKGSMNEITEEMKISFSQMFARLDRLEHHVRLTEATEGKPPKPELIETKPSVFFEQHLLPNSESASVQPSAPPEAPGPVDFNAQPSPIDESAYQPNPNQQPTSEVQFDLVESVEEDEDGDPVNPGQSSIPVNHTTGAARLLLVKPISELAKGIIVGDKIKNEKYPMLQEERLRSLLRNWLQTLFLTSKRRRSMDSL
jgi:hypothetical protein